MTDFKTTGPLFIGGDAVINKPPSSGIDLNVAASTAVPGKVQLATDGEANPNKAVKGDDPRLYDSRNPLPHGHDASDILTGLLATARLGTGTADATKFLRGDQTWASDHFDATFIVSATGGAAGSDDRKTHSTLASALAAALPYSSVHIHLLEGTHLHSMLTPFDTTGKKIKISGSAATIVSDGVSSWTLYFSGSGDLYLVGFDVSGGFGGLYCYPEVDLLADNIRFFGNGIGFVNKWLGSEPDTKKYPQKLISCHSVSDLGYGVGFSSSAIRGTLLIGCTGTGGSAAFSSGDGITLYHGCMSYGGSLGWQVTGSSTLSRVAVINCVANQSTCGLISTSVGEVILQGFIGESNLTDGCHFTNGTVMISGSLVNSSGNYGYRFINSSVDISGSSSRLCGKEGIHISSASPCRVAGNRIFRCSQLSPGAYSGIYVNHTASVEYMVCDNYVYGNPGEHYYGIYEAQGSGKITYQNNKSINAPVYGIFESSSEVLDPKEAYITITRLAGDGSGTEVIDSASHPAVNFKPRVIEFLSQETLNEVIYSQGNSDGSVNFCHRHNEAADRADLINCLNVESGGDGYTAVVGLIGKVDGNLQEGFRLDWTVIGVGKDVSVTAVLRR